MLASTLNGVADILQAFLLLWVVLQLGRLRDRVRKLEADG